MPNSRRKKDFFISYNRFDRPWAEWIAGVLEGAGYTTFYQAKDFGAGSNFVLQMQEAAVKCRRTLAVLSPTYLASRFTAPEWAAAFARDPTGSKRLLVPVRVARCWPKGLLGQTVYIDLVGQEESAARDLLLSGVVTEALPRPPAPFPATAKGVYPFPGLGGAIEVAQTIESPLEKWGFDELGRRLEQALSWGEIEELASYSLGFTVKGVVADEAKTQFLTDLLARAEGDGLSLRLLRWIGDHRPDIVSPESSHLEN